MDAEKTVTCPLCSNEFSTADLATCQFCADKGKCTLMCCPRCGYSFPQRRKDSEMRRLWRRLRPRRVKREQD